MSYIDGAKFDVLCTILELLSGKHPFEQWIVEYLEFFRGWKVKMDGFFTLVQEYKGDPVSLGQMRRE